MNPETIEALKGSMPRNGTVSELEGRMRAVLPSRLEEGRVTHGEFASRAEYGAYGKFIVQGPCGERLCIVASGADTDDAQSEGWEHVSVSTRRRTPNWTEMCFVKDLFWEPEECVVQFHPPRSEYVNNHPYVLHLWRQKTGFPAPPSILVGIKNRGLLTNTEAQQLRRDMLKAEGRSE